MVPRQRFSISGAAVTMEELDVSIRWDEVMDHGVLERRPMSLEEFDALPEGIRAEYVDGIAIVSPTPTGGHQDVEVEIAFALRRAFPDAVVRIEAGIELPWGTRRVPDVMMKHVRDDVPWSTALPDVVVEVLSPLTRNEDLFRKSLDYLRAGIPQYWIADRAAHVLTVLRGTGSDWTIALELDAGSPGGEVEVEGLGVVALDLAELRI